MTDISKIEVLNFCTSHLQEKISELKSEIRKVIEDATNETKSSMGDKYETGREMMMQERTKLSDRLEILLKQKVQIELIDDKEHDVIKYGSLVQTNLGVYLIATALGAIKLDNKQIYVISQGAPVAKKMIGKKAGDKFSFNGKEQVINQVN